MKQYRGDSVQNSIAIGTIAVYEKKTKSVMNKNVMDTDTEMKRFTEAKIRAVDQIKRLYEKAKREIGIENAQIFEIHQMLLEDEDYNESVREFICKQYKSAEYAVSLTEEKFVSYFRNMEDEYMRARSVDVKDISERIIQNLTGTREESKNNGPVIIAADELTPSETVQFERGHVLGFIIKNGSPNSHTAILAKAMQIPALIGVNIEESWDGKEAIVDGHNGELIVEPDDKTKRQYTDMKQKEEESRENLKKLKGKKTVTKNGHSVNLYANIGSLDDLAMVLQNDAEGIGLFRSEFIYLNAKDYPTEEEQFQIYKQVATVMSEKKVIIRTLDIGADKKVDYFRLDKEENPAMGYRAIRICLDRPDLFRVQLRAILRASAYGNISIMYPMITSVQEVRRIRSISKEVKKELKSEGIAYKADLEEGIMIETPAAAVISDKLACEVDFFSIGTNDLTQYTLAVDRMNTKLGAYYEPHHPAVLREIKMVIEHAHKAGIWCGICGELGADTELTQTFLDYGVDELSVSSGMILPLREQIRRSH